MGWLIQKTYLKWREPRIVRRAVAAQAARAESWWSRPVAALIVAVLLIISWGIAHLNPQKNPSSVWFMIHLSIGGGLAAVYLLPLLFQLCPSEVRVTEKAITRIIGNRVSYWPYNKIHSCQLAFREIGG